MDSTESQNAPKPTLEEVRALFRLYAGMVREHFGERVRDVWLYDGQ